jgi:GH24 family phage-related lysozyme (muramidase)
MLSAIQRKRKEYQGNYDGFFGKVSNFTWNFNPDGSYDISIDLITLGDVIESLKVNTSVKEKFYPDGGLFEDIKFEENSNPILKNLENTNIAKVATLNTLGYFLYKKIEEISSNKVGDKNSYIRFDIKESSSSKSPQYYVRLGEFLTQLENLIVPVVQNNNSDKFSQITFEKTGCLISYFPNQIPLDPRVCIFKPSLNSYGDITGVNNLTNFNNIPISYLASIDNITYGLLMNLYINFEFIAGLLVANGGPDQELSLYKFLQDLCNGINNALGGVNKLEPVIKEDYKITIIDQTLSFPEDKDTVSLEVYGYNPSNLDDDGTPSPVSNFVKDVKFVSKITPQLASMISIGATAAGGSTSEIDGTAFSKWSEGLVDRFAEKISEPSGLNLLETNQKAGAKSIAKYKEIFDKFQDAEIDVKIKRKRLQSEFGAILDLLRAYYVEGGIKDTRPKIVRGNPFYGDLGVMDFDTFVVKASEIDINRRLRGIRDENEISELVSTNYAVYLFKAFGGTSDKIKVEYQNYENVQSGTGASTSKRYLNTTTIKYLEVDINQRRYLEFDDTFISQGKSAYKTYINTLNNNRYKTDNIPSSEVGFIPLSFELILDGISGIKIYNKLNINNEFLPSNYPESLSFIITKVNHNISNNNWDTSLSTISIPKTEPLNTNLFLPQTNTQDTGGGNGGVVADNLRFDPKTLTTSNKGIEFIKKKEFFLPYAYDDKSGKFPPPPLTATTKIVNNKIVATGGTLSIGYGFTNAISRFLSEPIAGDSTITQAKADEIITKIIRESFEKTLQNTITAPLTQYEFDALISILYNTGEIGNRSAGQPTPLRDTLNNRDYQGAANIIPIYRATQNGLPNAGIQARRAKEQQVFISGNYGL